MEINTKNKILYSLKILIPIIVVITLFLSGISLGVITFEKPKDKITGKITATLMIEFNDGKNFTQTIIVENSTVLDLLKESEKYGDITIEASYNDQYQSYSVDSIIYSGKEYKSGDGGYYWTFNINNEFAMNSADKIYVENNDLIEWKFEKF